MNLMNGAEVAKAVGVNASTISRLKGRGYIDYADKQKKLYDEQAVRAAHEHFERVKAGELINHTTAAELLGVSKSTVTAMKERGELTVVQVGSKEVFYSLKEIETIRLAKQKETKAIESEDKDLEELKKAKLRLEIALHQQTLDERQGRVIPQEQVAQFVELLANKIGQWSSDGPARINMQIRHCKDDVERLPKIQKEIDKFLEEFQSLIAKEMAG